MEENQLVAEFIKMQKTDIGWFDSEGLLTQYVYDETGGNCHDQLYFDKSWDWLIPAFNKVMNICFEEEEKHEKDLISWFYDIRDTIPDRDHCYRAVVEFIKWYNGKKITEVQ